jgi:hypothetical protein
VLDISIAGWAKELLAYYMKKQVNFLEEGDDSPYIVGCPEARPCVRLKLVV